VPAFYFSRAARLMLPATLFGPPHWGLIIPMALVIFCGRVFGVLAFWKLLTGDTLGSRFPQFWAVFLVIRLTVDCARILMWR